MQTLYKNYIFDIVIALIALALGIVMLPVFGISEIFIDIMLALALGVYLVFFLFDRLRHSRGTVFILTIIEFIVISIENNRALWVHVLQHLCFCCQNAVSVFQIF